MIFSSTMESEEDGRFFSDANTSDEETLFEYMYESLLEAIVFSQICDSLILRGLFFVNSVHEQLLKQFTTQCIVGYWTSLLLLCTIAHAVGAIGSNGHATPLLVCALMHVPRPIVRAPSALSLA